MTQDRFVFVYLPELRVSGEMLSLGAHMSKVRYIKDGIAYEVYVSNEEFIERGSIGYEEENEQGTDSL